MSGESSSACSSKRLPGGRPGQQYTPPDPALLRAAPPGRTSKISIWIASKSKGSCIIVKPGGEAKKNSKHTSAATRGTSALRPGTSTQGRRSGGYSSSDPSKPPTHPLLAQEDMPGLIHHVKQAQERVVLLGWEESRPHSSAPRVCTC